jgi:hypothetical protein
MFTASSIVAVHGEAPFTLLHELASLECAHFRRTEIEPLSVLPFLLESHVPVSLDACRVVGANDMHGLEFLRKLNA